MENSLLKRLAYTFYAVNKEQMRCNALKLLCNAEAILFDYNDLLNPNWFIAWENIKQAVYIFGKQGISFHFPIDECNIIESHFVKEKLIETIKRCDDLGIEIIVLHSNFRYSLYTWPMYSISHLRDVFISEILEIAHKYSKYVCICIENMPPIGNNNDDADPLFLTVEDFKYNDQLVKITWDISHYYNMVASMEIARDNKEYKCILPRYEKCDYYDFYRIWDNIYHWHFSAFNNIANPISGDNCMEGCLPNMCHSVAETFFVTAINKIIKNSDKKIVLEISETDYVNRSNILNCIEWLNKNVKL
jgi:hypothetical protein